MIDTAKRSVVLAMAWQHRAALLILGVALAIRLWAILTAPHPFPVLDESEYLGAASVLADGRGFAFFLEAPWTRPPLYVVLLAALELVGGPGGLLVGLQVGLGLATLALGYLIVNRFVGRGPALLAAAAWALYYPLAIFSLLAMSETLFLFLLVCAWGLLLACGASQRAAAGLALAAGLVVGAAVLTRGLALGLIPLGGLWYAVRPLPLRSRAPALGAFLIGTLLLLGPWAAYTRVRFGQALFPDTTASYNLWLGVNGGLDGRRLQADLTALPTISQRQQWAYTQALMQVRADPLEFAGEVVRYAAKTWRISLGAEDRLVDGYAYGAITPAHLLTTFVLDDLLYLAVLAAALVAVARRRLPAAVLLGLVWVLYAWIGGSLFYTVSRFRYPLVPFLAVAAACLLLDGRHRRAGPGSRIAAGAGILAALVLVGSTLPVTDTDLGIQRWGQRQAVLAAQDLRARGQPDRALQELAGAAPELPETRAVRALSLAEVGDPGGGLAEADSALPSPYAYLAAGEILRRLGESERAQGRFGQRELASGYPMAWAWDALQSPPPARLDLGGGLDLGLLRGFAGAERDGDTTYRWSGAAARVRLAIPSDGPSRLQVRWRGYRPPGIGPADVSLAVGETILFHGTAPGDWQVLTVPLPVSPGRTLVLDISSTTFVAGGRDPRPLGVMVDWIGVSARE